jgi:uncharacterized protein YpmB
MKKQQPVLLLLLLIIFAAVLLADLLLHVQGMAAMTEAAAKAAIASTITEGRQAPSKIPASMMRIPAVV